jgi:hypothetical protein
MTVDLDLLSSVSVIYGNRIGYDFNPDPNLNLITHPRFPLPLPFQIPNSKISIHLFPYRLENSLFISYIPMFLSTSQYFYPQIPSLLPRSPVSECESNLDVTSIKSEHGILNSPVQYDTFPLSIAHPFKPPFIHQSIPYPFPQSSANFHNQKKKRKRILSFTFTATTTSKCTVM